ncbi:phage tail tape measure protein, partial [Shimia sp.]|uniref:phage tail tape measure protein n=1 Tax=Shimia sp. TaxID=1954381 RepID=UPI003B8AEBC6
MLDLLKFSIAADNRTARAFGAVKGDLAGIKGALASVDERAKRAGRSLRNVGLGVSATASLPATLGLKSIIDTAGGFEQSMNRVAALSGSTGDSFAALGKQAQDLGASTKFSASEAADAMGFLAMAGFEAKEILGAMPSTLQLASSAGADLATSADIVSNVLTGFGKDVAELAAVNDTLVKAMTSSNTDLRMLGDSMKYVGPVAGAAALDFNEITAAIGLLGNAGIQGEMSGTALRGVISRLLNPTKDAASVMREMGINAVNADGQIENLAAVLEAFAPHANDAGLLMTVFGQRAGPAMAALLAQGSGELRAFEQQLVNAGGTAAEIASVQMQGLRGSTTELKSSLQGLAIAVGQSGLLEFVTGLTQSATALVRKLAGMDSGVLAVSAAILGLTAAAGPALTALGFFVTGASSLVPLLGGVVGGFAALTRGAAALAPALWAAAGPWGILAGLAGGAAAYFLLFREEAEKIPTPLEAAYEAQNSLNSQLGIFHAVAAPEAGKAAINAANDFYQMAAAAREAAASNLAMVQSELAAQRVWNDSMPWESFGGDLMEKVIAEDVAVAKEELAEAEALLATAQNQRASTARQVMTADREMANNLGVVSDEVKIAIDGIEGLSASLGKVGSSGSGSLKKLKDSAKDVGDTLSETGQMVGRTFSEVVRHSDLAGDAVSRLLDQLADKALMQIFTNLWGKSGLDNIFGGLFANAKGNAFSGGEVVPFASGGIVSRPTFFPMAGKETGLMGEAGPEAIMPLTRIGGKLGVRSQSGSGGTVSVRVYVDDTGNWQ